MAADMPLEWGVVDSDERRPKNMSAKKRKAGKSKRAKLARTGTTKKKAQNVKAHGKANTAELVSYGRRGLGARSGGQAGDTQGISSRVDLDSESVEELLEEGQSFEAEALNGVENAPDPDQGEVRTRQLPEDDVPEEYREQD